MKKSESKPDSTSRFPLTFIENSIARKYPNLFTSSICFETPRKATRETILKKRNRAALTFTQRCSVIMPFLVADEKKEAQI